MEQVNILKSKISYNLNNLNKSSQVFDDMINDYNTLYQKYIDIQFRTEPSQRLNSIQVSKIENLINPDESELEKKYKLLQDEFVKLKSTNEKNIETINENVKQIMELKNTINVKDKNIDRYSAENSVIKQQHIAADKKNKELSEINQKNLKIINDLTKHNQKLQIDHKKLIDNSGKMYMEIEKLRNKLLELQEQSIIKASQYIEESSKSKIYNSEINLNKNKGNIPKSLLFKQKIYNNPINSIYFNNSGKSYLIIGDDNSIHIYDTAQKNETNRFSDFQNKISEACFDYKEELIFAGSYDKTLKLYSLKDNQLLNTFSGHNNCINCVKSFNRNEYGLTGSSDNTIRQWDFNTKNLMRKYNCNNECHSMDIAPDDSFILSGHLDGSVKMWGNGDTYEKNFNLHEDKVMNIKIIRNDLFLTLGKDKKIKLFDLRNEKDIYTIDESLIPDWIDNSVAISPDKKIFAIGSKKGLVYFVNLNDGSINSKINNGSISTLNWRPHNSQIYVGDSNGFLSIWGTG